MGAQRNTTTTTGIFLGDKNTGGQNGINADPAILAYLQGRYGKTNVTDLDTEPSGTVKAAHILGFDVAVLSSTPNSKRYRNKLHNSPTPIVNLRAGMADNDKVGWFAVTQDALIAAQEALATAYSQISTEINRIDAELRSLYPRYYELLGIQPHVRPRPTFIGESPGASEASAEINNPPRGAREPVGLHLRIKRLRARRSRLDELRRALYQREQELIEIIMGG